MCIPETTSAHIDFNDWLTACPVVWVREKLTDQSVIYEFTLPDIEEDES